MRKSLGGLGAWGATQVSLAVFGNTAPTGMWAMVGNGALQGSIRGAAIGLATGIASGDDFATSLDRIALGAITGAIVGAAFGYAEFKAREFLNSPALSKSEFNQQTQRMIGENAKSANGNIQTFAKDSVLDYAMLWLKTGPGKEALKPVVDYVFSDAGYIIVTQAFAGLANLEPELAKGLIPDKFEFKYEKEF